MPKIKEASTNTPFLEGASLGEILRNARIASRVSQEEFSERTKIPLHYILAIEEDKISELPPDTFTRGIIKKYAAMFGLPEDELLGIFDIQSQRMVSGPQNHLPKNRFEVKFGQFINLTKMKLHPALLVLIFALFYLVFVSRAFLFEPKIEIYEPAENLLSNVSQITVSGRVFGAKKLFINGIEVLPSGSGAFSFDALLNEGLNSIEVSARNFLGKESRAKRFVIYQPPPSPSPTPSPSPEPFFILTLPSPSPSP
ncbi:MAG: helix-turn-helix domain-containing protein [Candidatus Paceibacteria bacterium]